MMNNAQLAAASFNDIVFDGRNKGYGAYELRRLYQRHVSRALVIATTIFALLVFSPVVANYLRGEAPVVPLTKTTPAEPILPPPTEVEKVLPPVAPPVRPAPPPPPVATVRSTEFRVTRDQDADDKVPEAEKLLTTTIGPRDAEGPATTGPPIDLPPVEGPKEMGGIVAEKPYFSVEQMPELPGGGGVAAIVAAIQKAARYPSRAMGAGVEGRVYVSFVVNAQGEVVDVKIVKGLGSGLDEETVRAIKTLPRFIPGKQNGREVSVSYSVPVTFKIQ